MPIFAVACAILLVAVSWLVLRHSVSHLSGNQRLSFLEELFPTKPTAHYFIGALLGALIACSLSAHYLLFWLRTPLARVAILLTIFPVFTALLGAFFQRASKAFKPTPPAKILGLWAFAFIFLAAFLSTLTTWQSVLPPGIANPHYELQFSRPPGISTQSEPIELVEVKLYSALGPAQKLPYGACRGDQAQGWTGTELASADSTQDQSLLICHFVAQPGDYLEVLLSSLGTEQQAVDIWVNGLHYTQISLDGSLRFLPITLPTTPHSIAATVIDNSARLALPGLALFILFSLAIHRNWLTFPALALAVFGLASSIVFLRNAWVVEDQFITMRVVENLVHGYGPNFNVGYRVQAFTHPLWMLLLSAIYLLANQISPAADFLSLYYITAITSLALAALSLALIFRIGNYRDPLVAFIGASLLLLSKSFVDYSLSGLENALVNVLLLSFILQLYLDSRNEQKLFWPFFTASCAVITRQDTLLLLLPSLVYLLWKHRHKLQDWSGAVLGLFPVFVWHAFSIVYYGFLVPNTAFAKLNTGIPRIELIEQGLAFFANAVQWDLVALLAMAFALAIAAFQREPRRGVIAVGILTYLLYIMWIGGDFMSGRFLVAPLVMSVGILITYPYQRVTLAAMVAIALVGLFNERSPLYANLNYGQIIPVEAYYDEQIADERAVFFAQTSLLRNFSGQELARSHWLDWRTTPDLARDVLVLDSIGLAGYRLGPNYVLIDEYALADPLLSKLPANFTENWRIGHFERRVPNGYRQTLLLNKNQIENPHLAAFWERLSLLVQGDIWSLQRFTVIWKMNTGEYQHLLDSYIDSQ